jgi:hypothetical protein
MGFNRLVFRKIRTFRRNASTLACSLILHAILLGLLFDPEDGGDMFLRIVRLFPNCMVLEPLRPFAL